MLAPVFSRLKHGQFAFRSVVPAVAICVVIGALVAGCGSQYTKHDFIKRADGICLNATRALRSLTTPQFTGSAVQQRMSLSRYLARVSRIVSAESASLAKLPKPPGRPAESALLKRWLHAVKASASEIHVLGDAEHAGNAGFIAAARSALAALPVVTLASRYGAKDCAGPGATYSFPAVK
jgi:hypothetical protein